MAIDCWEITNQKEGCVNLMAFSITSRRMPEDEAKGYPLCLLIDSKDLALLLNNK